MAGLPHQVPPSVPLKGQKLYYDPCNPRMQDLQRVRKETLQKIQAKREAEEYQAKLRTIPKAEYFPTTRLFEMKKAKHAQSISYNDSSASASFITDQPQSYGAASEYDNISSRNIDFFPSVSNSNNNDDNNNSRMYGLSERSNYSSTIVGNNNYNNYGGSDATVDKNWNERYEEELKAVMKAAKNGDTDALYEYSMRKHSADHYFKSSRSSCDIGNTRLNSSSSSKLSAATISSTV